MDDNAPATKMQSNIGWYKDDSRVHLPVERKKGFEMEKGFENEIEKI